VLKGILEQEAGEAANWKINDSRFVDFMVTAKRVTDGLPWYFTKDSPKNGGLTGRLPFLDCIVASAAAPTYFPPWPIRDASLPPEHRELILTDGGVGIAGNPVYIASVEAFEFAEGYEQADTIVISLGTGRFSQQVKTPSWILPWIKWIVTELLQSSGEQQTELVKRHYPNVKLYRIDPNLSKLDPTLQKPIEDHAPDKRFLLKRLGETFARTVPWPEILAGTDKTFLVDPRKTLPKEYQAV
jgi:hypothetical protein